MPTVDVRISAVGGSKGIYGVRHEWKDHFSEGAETPWRLSGSGANDDVTTFNYGQQHVGVIQLASGNVNGNNRYMQKNSRAYLRGIEEMVWCYTSPDWSSVDHAFGCGDRDGGEKGCWLLVNRSGLGNTHWFSVKGDGAEQQWNTGFTVVNNQWLYFRMTRTGDATILCELFDTDYAQKGVGFGNHVGRSFPGVQWYGVMQDLAWCRVGTRTSANRHLQLDWWYTRIALDY